MSMNRKKEALLKSLKDDIEDWLAAVRCLGNECASTDSVLERILSKAEKVGEMQKKDVPSPDGKSYPVLIVYPSAVYDEKAESNEDWTAWYTHLTEEDIRRCDKILDAYRDKGISTRATGGFEEVTDYILRY